MKIEKLKNGLLSVKVYLGQENGHKIYKRVSARSEREVKAEARKLKAQYELSLMDDTTSKSPTLFEAFTSFIEARSNVLSPSTLRAYYSIRDNSFKGIMQKSIDEVTQEDVQREINAEASNLSSKTIRNKLALFTSVYNTYAKKPKKLSVNVPAKKRAEIYIPTREDIDKVLEVCQFTEEGRKLRIPIMLGAFLGLRRGEIGALTWDDIKGDTLTINKALVKTKENTYQEKQPKSYAGYRVLKLPPVLQQELKKHKKTKRPLIELSIDRISDGFRVVLKHAGVKPFRFHDLRHFFASTLLALNVPDLYAIKLTGHSTTSMLKNVYQHTFLDKEEEVEEKLNSTFI